MSFLISCSICANTPPLLTKLLVLSRQLITPIFMDSQLFFELKVFAGLNNPFLTRQRANAMQIKSNTNALIDMNAIAVVEICSCDLFESEVKVGIDVGELVMNSVTNTVVITSVVLSVR